MRINLRQDYVLRKEYDFTTLPDLAEFTTKAEWRREDALGGERQFYTDGTQTTLSGAGLRITAEPKPPGSDTRVLTAKGRRELPYRFTREQLSQPGMAVQQPYVSGILTTRDQGYSQLFGYWVVRAKLPQAIGAFPAAWLLPTHRGFPAGYQRLPEIDILEAINSVKDGTYFGTVHSGVGPNSDANVMNDNSRINTAADLVGEYHDYGMEWTKEEITWYFDGVATHSTPTPAALQGQPCHLLLNLAVGGDWPGEPRAQDYPVSLDIERVGIYERRPPRGGDVIWTLKNGRQVTKRDLNKVTEYLIELNASS